ncbi:hypothetical protein [Methanotorris formicicus]|nr:hypothetical protein [Methanotorris formicicus]
MIGMNPLILNFIVLVSFIVLFIAVFFIMNSLVIISLTAILLISLISYVYSFIKVESVDKGKLIHKDKISLSKLRYDSFIVLILGVMIILYYKHIIPTWLLVALIILDFAYRCLGNYIILKPPIKVYEKGIVLGSTAFYTWDELNMNEEGDKIKIKIKYIPKRIVLDKNILDKLRSKYGGN